MPAALGYCMPAEWEPHAATWLAWPHFHGDWPGRFEPILWVYAEIIRTLAKHERVELIVNNAAAARQARRVLERADAFSANIRFHHWPTNRVWLRDSGCIFLKCGAGSPAREKPVPPVTLKFRFNAWAKYSNWRYDDKIGSLMARVKTPTSRAKNAREMGHPMPLTKSTRCQPENHRAQGGSIDVNGAGTILTTEECLPEQGTGAQSAHDARALRKGLRRPPRLSAYDLAGTRHSATIRTATSMT